jgi:uncharacterized protein YneF (UPF0154 family)
MEFNVDFNNTAASVVWAIVVFFIAGMWINRKRGGK